MANPSLEVEIWTVVKKVAGAAAVIKFAKDIVQAASGAEQSIGAVDAVFKQSSETIKKWATESGQKLGLAANDYRELATLIGTQLKAAGTSMSDLAPETNRLIELGSDLAAQFGGTTKEAVEALSSAMKGELNPIEKYGVSLSQTRLAAKAASMGLGDLWKSGDAATKQQVLMAAIMEQSADALGANAREAGTAEGKWNRLTAAWADAKTRMGAALLPAFQSLMDIMNRVLPVVEPIITGFASLVSAVSKLPMPLLAGGAAMGTFLIKSGGIAAAFKGWTSGATSFGTAMKGVGKNLAVGGAVAAAGIGIGILVDKFGQAAQRAEESRKRVAELTDVLVASGGKWTEAATEMQQAQVAQTGTFQSLIASGVSYADAMAGLTGNLGASEDATKSYLVAAGEMLLGGDAAAASISLEAEAAKKNAAGALEMKKQTEARTKAVKTATAAITSGIGAIVQFTSASEKAGEPLVKIEGPVKAVADGIDGLAGAVLDAARNGVEFAAANSAVSKALADTDAKASDAKRALDYLQVAIDKLSGRNRTAEQATADFNASLLDMASAAKEAKENGGLNTKALKTWNVAALTATDTGQKVYKSLDGTASSYAAVTSAAYSNTAATKGTAAAQKAARAAADTARAAFVKQAAGFGLNSTQAGKLADKLGVLEGKKLTKKQFDVIAKDQKAQQAVRDIDKAKVKDKTLNVKGDASGARKSVDSIRNMRLETKTQQVTGDTSAATAKINELKRLGIPDKYARIIAEAKNLGSAQSQIAAVANRGYTAVINVAVAGVQAAINAARSVINSVTGRSAAAPRSAPITAEGYAAPQVAGFSTFAARGRAASAPGPSAFKHGMQNPLGGNIIVVNGALDPDRVARQINGYVTARNRRTGPVTMGHSVLAV